MAAATSLQKHPLHKRAAVEKGLRELVATLSPGDRLPPMPNLRRHFGVASGTVQAAVEVLSTEGLVIRRHGAGTFVSPVSPPLVPTINPPAATQMLAVFAGIASAYYHDCVEHLIPQAAQQGLGVECRYSDEGLTLDDVLRYESRGVAGYLAIGSEMEWVAAAMRARGHRAVVLGEPVAGIELRVPASYSDAEQGGYLAAQHLLRQGHRRIAYLYTRTPEWLFQRRRYHGHLRALSEAGIVAPPLLLHGTTTVEGWYDTPEDARRYFRAPHAPTAVAAWTDTDAIKLLGALQRAEIRVPDEVSLIGYDNFLHGAHCWPPLDSVDQHIDVLVRHALTLLSAPVFLPVVSAPHVTPTLVCRSSVCPCRREQ